MLNPKSSYSIPKALVTANRRDLATLIAKGLERQQWQVAIANEKAEILDLISQHKFQLMIIDLDGSEQQNLDLLRQLQQQQCEIPVLILTSYEEHGDRACQLFSAVHKVLIKPFRIQDIIQQSSLVLS